MSGSLLQEVSDKAKFPEQHWRTLAAKQHLDFVRTCQADSQCVRSVLEEATLMRDEYLQNRQFKNAITRNQVGVLCIVLTVLVISTLTLMPSSFDAVNKLSEMAGISSGEPETDNTANQGAICAIALLLSFCGIAVFGAIGATISAIMSFVNTNPEARIPEHFMRTWLTGSRPVIGAVSALVLSFATLSGVVLLVRVDTNKAAYMLWLVSFAAGFSERLVIRAVSAPFKPNE